LRLGKRGGGSGGRDEHRADGPATQIGMTMPAHGPLHEDSSEQATLTSRPRLEVWPSRRRVSWSWLPRHAGARPCPRCPHRARARRGCASPELGGVVRAAATCCCLATRTLHAGRCGAVEATCCRRPLSVARSTRPRLRAPTAAQRRSSCAPPDVRVVSRSPRRGTEDRAVR